MADSMVHFVDGVSSMAIHNGVVRVQFMRLGLDGKPIPTVEIDVPVQQVKAVAEAFSKAAPAGKF